jgi:amino acid transporter
MMTIAVATRFGVYDMAGYYDVCFMGGVVRNPKRNIPLSCVGTCCIVAVIYVLTYIAVLGHLDWRTFVDVYSDHYEGDAIPPGIISTFTESRVGKWLAYPISVVVAITIFASNFSVLCGQHYVPYAAAKDGVFFSVFAHESKRYPGVADLSLLVVILLSGVWCFFSLDLVIEAMVNLIVFVQFLAQSVGLMYYRYRVPKDQQVQGWRMPLFPLPCIIQAVLFFLHLDHDGFRRPLRK